ncbi:MAG TPA: hypothetical protein VFC41_07225 [Anaerovoracaceae bacterium]|nr:hypothetical protein [Anaerovoracaceae bacterium]
MHEKTIILLILIGLFAVGIIKTIIKIIKLADRKDFTAEYLNKFRQFLSSNNFDGEIFGWLTLNAGKIQLELGSDGVMYSYKPAFANYIYNEYLLIINTLPGIRNGNADNHDVFACEEALIRHIGNIQMNIQEYRKYLYNPLIWLREGIRFCVALPLYFTHWMGLFQYNRIARIENSWLFNFFTSIITILGLFSSIVTIALGWNGFIDLINKWI